MNPDEYAAAGLPNQEIEPQEQGYYADRLFTEKTAQYKIIVPGYVIEQIERYVDAAKGNPTGSILIGYYTDDFASAIITQSAHIPFDNKYSSEAFSRGVCGLQNALNIAWKRKQYYLGEWQYNENAFMGSPVTAGMQNIVHNEDMKCPEAIFLRVTKFKAHGDIVPRIRVWPTLFRRGEVPLKYDAES